GARDADGGAVAWGIACRPPGRVVRAVVLAGLALFLPYFLLAPLIHGDPSAATPDRVQVPAVLWSVFLRGMTGMFVSIATVTTLTAADLHEALVRLPVPRMVSAILVQVVHQTGVLVHETRQVASAMAVRGASTGGRTAWRVLSSLPRVWLPRVLRRAERVGAAMELRGYGPDAVAAIRVRALRPVDGLALAPAGAWLAFAFAVRWWGGP
ncbi:MAG: energy-coupling factor transporter transmembrane component T, partial [Myxococcota bacterium]|nr:energy-coupling factor transporter transmembrane component T [Myxococcota bacterium]